MKQEKIIQDLRAKLKKTQEMMDKQIKGEEDFVHAEGFRTRDAKKNEQHICHRGHRAKQRRPKTTNSEFQELD